MTTQKIVLAKSADWKKWIFSVKTKAMNSGVWDLINPDLNIKPLQQERPIKPTFVVPQSTNEIDKDSYKLFKIQISAYKHDLDEYDRQQNALMEIINFIHDSLSVQTALFIKNVDAHPWSQLRALKARLAPTDQARSIEVERLYHRLAKGPGNRDVEAWIQEWEFMYADAMSLAICEVKGQRAQRDFLLAVAKYEPAFSDNYLLRITDEDESFEMDRLVEEFRHLIR